MVISEIEALAALSHRLERLALGLASEGLDEHFVTQEIASAAAGEREALAISLSYLLRHRTLGTFDGDDNVLDVAVDATVAAMRRR